jgi:hypothetical protein
MTASEGSKTSSETIAISATLTGVISPYGDPEAGVVRGMTADLDGGG